MLAGECVFALFRGDEDDENDTRRAKVGALLIAEALARHGGG